MPDPLPHRDPLSHRDPAPHRYEFRVFGAALSGPRAALADLARPCGRDSRTDIYLLGAPAPYGLKLRDGTQLERKRLLRRAQGLEQWRPAGAIALPAPRSALATALGLAGLPPLPETVTAAALIQAATAHGLRCPEVEKHRQRFALGPLRAEITRLRSGPLCRWTLAIEGPHPAALQALRARLGLSQQPNCSYPRWLLQGTR